MAGSSLASTLTRPRVNYLPSLGRKRKEKDDITPIRAWGDHSSTPTGTHCDESFQNLRWRRHTVLSPLALLDHGLCNTYNLRWVHACMLDIDLFAAGWACCPGWNGRLHACMVLGDLCPSLVIISQTVTFTTGMAVCIVFDFPRTYHNRQYSGCEANCNAEPSWHFFFGSRVHGILWH
jgi:hypothetical protein